MVFGLEKYIRMEYEKSPQLCYAEEHQYKSNYTSLIMKTYDSC
jgi:hypothetical protein